jgi:RNA polymerase sigma-70 factor (ECF subfamily)
LQAPLGTVKAQLHRARELLYDLVKDKKEFI